MRPSGDRLSADDIRRLLGEFAHDTPVVVTRIRYRNRQELRFPERMARTALLAEILQAIEDGWQHGGDLEVELPRAGKLLVGHHDGIYWLEERHPGGKPPLDEGGSACP